MSEYIERVWIVAGTEFGSEADQSILVKKAIYGLNIYGAEFRSRLSEKYMKWVTSQYI